MKISEHIYSVGILNPNMRIFDVIMRTEYGTSYNSYIVKGENKTALVETVHSGYEDTFLENIKAVCSPDEIDYIILNHTEPDHSGCLKYISEIMPNAQILCSTAASIYLKNITNNSALNIKAVKDGETLDLGGITFKFIMAPFLHWPDSMFTYVEEEQTVFTCDFLGAHYCEPEVFDHKVHYIHSYEDAVKYYFDCIFGPFKPYVQKGLAKLSEISFTTVCTSHGPVLTENGHLFHCLKMYDVWSKPIEESTDKTFNIPIFYCSAYDNTLVLAKNIAQGIEQSATQHNATANISVYDINDHDIADLSAQMNSSDAFLIGSPTINKAAAPLVWHLLSGTDAIGCKNKLVATFGSYGWSGEAVKQMNSFLSSLGYKVADENGFRAIFVPNKTEIDGAFNYGKKFGELIFG